MIFSSRGLISSGITAGRLSAFRPTQPSNGNAHRRELSRVTVRELRVDHPADFPGARSTRRRQLLDRGEHTRDLLVHLFITAHSVNPELGRLLERGSRDAIHRGELRERPSVVAGCDVHDALLFSFCCFACKTTVTGY